MNSPQPTKYLSRNEIPLSHKYFIPKHINLSQREKEKLANVNKSKLKQDEENSSLYIYKKLMGLDRKYSPEISLYDYSDDQFHPCARGETSFKQYPYRSLDNQIKAKNFIDKELLNDKYYKNNNKEISNKEVEIVFEEAENLNETANNINNNINIKLPFDYPNDLNNINNKIQLGQDINKNDYLKWEELLKTKIKKNGTFNNFIKGNNSYFNSLSKFSDLSLSQYIISNYRILNKNEFFDTENILLNSQNKRFLESKYISGYNEHFVNYMLKKNVKNNFKKIVKIANFESNRKNPNLGIKIGINSNNSNMTNLNAHKDKERKKSLDKISVKKANLNHQLNLTPKDMIPQEIRYLIEKRIISGEEFDI